MKLGFVSAILPELNLEEVFSFAAEIGYDCVEVMCWPLGEADRRYAGVTHIDVTNFSEKEAAEIQHLSKKYGVSISGLGYYPNPLSKDQDARIIYIEHIKKVIRVAGMLGLENMNTFIGRDHTKTVEENWPDCLRIWRDIVQYAESEGIRIGIENCPMSFTYDEWPGGKNLASSPKIWRHLFSDIESDYLGLNYDPSHMVLQQMDYLSPMRNFAHKLFHVHAKDLRIDHHILNEVGVFAPPNEWHTPKLPGMGDVNWGEFFSILTCTGYNGAVCVEVEDRVFEGSLERRKSALKQSYVYLKQFVN